MCRRYQEHHGFFFQSSISKKRQEEIIEWIKSLNDDHCRMIEEIINDAMLEQSYID